MEGAFTQIDIFLDFRKEAAYIDRCTDYMFFLYEYMYLFHLQYFQRLDMFDYSLEYSVY